MGGPQSGELGGGQVPQGPGAVGRAVDREIVHDDRNPVMRILDVGLDVEVQRRGEDVA